MSQVEALLAEFERGGGTVTVDGGKVRVKYPETQRNAIAPILVSLRQHKEEVIRFLAGNMALCGDSECAGCYEVEPGKRIHPRKVSEAWLQQWKPKREDREQ